MIEINNKRLCECCFAETDSETCPHCGYNPNTYICDPAVLPCGSILMGKYIVGLVIGKGGFGITYKAYDINAQKVVAIKEYYPNGLANRTAGNPTITVSTAEDANIFRIGSEKFYNEARLVSKFNGNPGIVSVYEFFYENDTVYFTMEYLNGKSLKKYIDENGVLSEGQTVYIANCVSAALLAAHSINVLHRDISPDNIMICNDGTVKLIDFGAARQITLEGSQNFSVILKQGFAPLEQYQKKGKQGPWTDIYSLGATLYYALTRDTIDDPMSRMDDDSDLESNKYGISQPLFDIIRKATMLKTAERYGDIFMFKNALSAVNIVPVPLVTSAEIEASVPEHRTAQPYAASAAYKSQKKNSEPENYTKPIEESIPSKTDAVSAAPVAASDNVAANNVNKTNRIIIIAAAAVIAVALITVSIILLGKKAPDDDPSTAQASTSQSEAADTTSKVTQPPKQETEKKTTTTPPTEKETEKTTTTPPPTEKETEKTTTTAAPDGVKEVTIGGKKFDVNSTRLDLKNMNLKNGDIEDLKYMEKLISVDLSNNQLTDISVLKNNSRLQDICADNNKITDISFMADLKKLEKISLNKNNISDISVFRNLPQIKGIWLEENNVFDISPLAGCRNLEEVGLSENGGFSDISVFKGMSKIKYLHLGSENITDISALSTCTALKEVYLYNNHITDFSPLTKLKNLQIVCLNNNCIFTDKIASTLFGMKVDIKLELYENGITDEIALALSQNIYSTDGKGMIYY